ncbi:MAG: DUF2330 domain-containing protein [Planctomycetes bacterium]|nr:DUF2330 domain-containing protein [Planctomycetota bacterium]
MRFRAGWCLVGFCVASMAICGAFRASACCPVGRIGQPVVNADQTMVILWDAATKTQHLIRQANFKSTGPDFGFLVPTPTEPELSESGNAAFPLLQKLTAPEVRRVSRPRSGSGGCGCADEPAYIAGKAVNSEVRVLQQKLVAGFDASVLAADSAGALVEWLKEHDYAFSSEVEEWAQPYVEAGWKITALKIAQSDEPAAGNTVAASALRLTFATDKPIFPYREPDFQQQPGQLGAFDRLLRIYFIAESRYQGELTARDRWTGQVAWSDRVNEAQRREILEQLNLPRETGPENWWLTEFEDHWPYAKAPADLTFAASDEQSMVHREPIIEYVSTSAPPDLMTGALIALFAAPYCWRKIRRKRRTVGSPDGVSQIPGARGPLTPDAQ